jgi:hypothetical protein
VWRLVLLASLPLAGLARAEERYDHRGALGLTVAAGGEFVSYIAPQLGSESAGRVPIELGGTWSFTERTELRLAGRLSPSPTGRPLAGAVLAGIRNARGTEQWKTFFDLDLAVHVAPVLIIGARAAFGVQYDFLPVMGVYAQLGGQLGGGAGLRLSFEGAVGLQLRTYVLE